MYKEREWLPYEESIKIIQKDVKKYGITGCKSWQNIYVGQNIIPNNIPKQPHITYKNKGWISWGQWLGTNSICNKRIQFLPFTEAYSFIEKIIVKYNIKDKTKWSLIYAQHKNEFMNIPSNPNRTFRGKGWVSWGHWLRTGKVVGGQRKYSINEDYFKAWSSDMAYILGFWFADGNIKQKRIFSIYQHSRDKELLKKILNRMGTQHFFYLDKRNDHCYISISSKAIYKDIIELGGEPHKSLTVDFPKIPEVYISDFLRGNFDGDGSIYYDKCNKKYFSCFCSGSKNFIDNMKLIFDKNGIDCKIIMAIRKGVCFYWLRFNAANTISLGRFLYGNMGKDSLFMPRKHDRFMAAEKIIFATRKLYNKIISV